MQESQINVHLFEYGGGMVVGTDDIEFARPRMQRAIRERWEDASPVPWQLYDFSHEEPSVQRGVIVPDDDPEFSRWERSDIGIHAVVWR